MVAAMPLSSTLAWPLRTYCARNVDGASRNAIDSVGHASMAKIACSTKIKTTADVAVPAMMRKQDHEASASAKSSSSSTSLCVRHALRTLRGLLHCVREMTCMPAALFPSPPL
jgi:hypothetical protein